MLRVIKLMIGCQGQWRAGKKDPQAPWVVGSKGQTSAQAQCTVEIRTLYRLFPPGCSPYGPEADSQLPIPARRPVGVSEKWLYGDLSLQRPILADC